jgi:hypothetical protein
MAEYRHTVWPGAGMVFTSIPKTANTSVKTALLQTFMPDVPRKAPHAADLPYQTVSPRQIAKEYPDYFRCTVVRDPFDRMVSFFTDKIEGTINGSGMNDRLKRLGFERGMPFAAAVELACSIPDERTDPHVRSQAFHVLGPNERLVPDLLLRFEQLEADWAMLSHIVAVKTGARLPSLGRRRASVRRPRDDYYDETTRALVVERYRKDFEILGYPVEGGTDASDSVDSDDPVWASLGDRAGFAMLDLTGADPGRAEAVRRRSGHYLAPVRHGPSGQLSRLTAVQRGRVPDSAFDVLVISEASLANGSSIYGSLRDHFQSAGRTVVVTPGVHVPDIDELPTTGRKTPLTALTDGNFSGVPVASSIQRAVDRYGWREALRRAPHAVDRRVRPKLAEAGQTIRARVDAHRRGGEERQAATLRTLTPPDALRENGYYAVRGLLTEDDCRDLAKNLKAELGVTSTKQRTSTDAVNRFETARRLLLDDRVLHAVGAALGDGFRFLQVADLQYNHDHVQWHRDSPYRDAAGGFRRDWDESADPYHVAKLIVYLESDNAGMGILPGTHLTREDMNAARVRKLEDGGEYTVIGPGDEPNRRLTEQERARPLAWRACAGDALIFDERLYHCGRRVEDRRVIRDREGTKLTLSFVFGLDNAHSARMYSYFRFARRETGYKDLPADLAAELERRRLVLSYGWGNYFETAPEELRGAYLRDASKMEDLIHEFAGRSVR